MYDAVFLPAWDDKFFAGCGFWVAALLWLPAGVVAQALIRFAPGLVDAPGPGLFDLLMGAGITGFRRSLRPAAGARLPSRLAARLPARGRWAWVGLGAATVAASVVAGLLGPIAIMACAIALSLPVWAAWWRLAPRG